MRTRIAIFPAGTEIGLEIHRALKYSTYVQVFGCTSVKDHSKLVYKNYVDGLPLYNEIGFLDSLNFYIEDNKIDFIYPAHDDVQLFLTENADKIKATVLTTDLETVRICRSKRKTYEYLKDENFTPKFFDNIKDVNEFPVFIKPDIGQGARGAKIINNQFQLEIATNENPQIVICEYLSGKEYTIDCFTDFSGDLRACNLRSRERIKTGISVNSKILPMNGKVFEIANRINQLFKFNGAWFFQLKKDIYNNYKLLEIAPRVSGTMGLSRNMGVNYPLLTVFNELKIPVTLIKNTYDIEVDRAFISRYITNIEYNTVYVDLDDTLIVNGKVNDFLMMFLYQAVNNKKEIILISKHDYDISETLKKHKISIELFNSIIHVNRQDKKTNHMLENKSIFIDDSFAERLQVSTKLGIPVFDSSEVEALVDWRV